MSKMFSFKLDTTIKLIKKIRSIIFDLFFPKFCVGCNTEGTLLCVKCAAKIVPIRVQVCPECLRLSENGKFCAKCRKNKDLNGIFVAAYFEEGPIREMIHNFKYNHALELKKKLSKLMVEALNRGHCEERSDEAISQIDRRATARDDRRRNDNIRFDIVTFTPLHHRRLAERGFNQAQILAEEVAKIKKLPCEQLLIKIKSTKRQVGLTGKKRRENLGGVFRVNKGVSIKGKNILIIDDVTTTGATLNECAKTLKKEGVKEVWGLVVARG